MNEKHKKFCLEYLANGFNGTQAYLATYPSVKKEETARAAAARLLTNVSVQEFIKAEQDKSSEQLVITRESLLEDLKRIQANTEANNPNAALKAVDLMIKMLGFNAPIKQETKLSGGLDVTKLFGFDEDDKAE